MLRSSTSGTLRDLLLLGGKKEGVMGELDKRFVGFLHLWML
jgi:hypothetical protein